MNSFTVVTQAKRQVVDLTEPVGQSLPSEGSGVALVFVRHTTAALTTADLDPGTDQDFLDFLEAVTPQHAWRHPHDPAHAPDHLLASLIGCSVSLPYSDGELQLGTWQRVVLVELDGPRNRQVLVTVLSETGEALEEDDDE